MPFFFAHKRLAEAQKLRLDTLEMKMAALELAWLETLALLKKAAGRVYAERKALKGVPETDDVAPGASNGHKLNADVDRWRVR